MVLFSNITTLSSLNCIGEYLDINSGRYTSTNSLRALIGAWLGASQTRIYGINSQNTLLQ